jgi:hypothetical protein
MSTANPRYLNVFIVEEFETSGGKTGHNWTKVGVAFPHADSGGFNIELKAFPRDGRLVALPPQSGEREDKSSEVKGAVAKAVSTTKAVAAKERTR